ncbi:hypothetical protein DFJ58DRAFT_766571 [Suillus subalutaceus]|uniref:uncharacterized protein n=1 Tax=Suillus subalutaceus TaxID=48586 RepID=UPI001B87D006|nr:uncharacterized protein DFJ58DRAFT_766571 [Suillus subalutaceus]KAG1869001.1 hypothetical protein DFJ58DRAFT_766571 [Suillus subalutaceus]
MKIQSTYYLTILAAFAGVNAALADMCRHVCANQVSECPAAGGWGLVRDNSLGCYTCGTADISANCASDEVLVWDSSIRAYTCCPDK